MSDRLIIVGAGMTGLLAGTMLHRMPLQIVERETSLPGMNAVRRFRTDKVSEQLRIPFREVEVVKSIDVDDPIKAAMMYSRKLTHGYKVRSLIDLSPAKRFVAPLDLAETLASRLDVAFGVDGLAYCAPEKRDEMKMSPIISTLPMCKLMDALEYDGPRPDFKYVRGYQVRAKIVNCDFYATLYFAAPYSSLHRATLTGDQLVLEYVGDPPLLRETTFTDVVGVAEEFGISENDIGISYGPIRYRYTKLAALSDDDRRKANEFMSWASVNWNVFSLGRLAKWQSGLRLDDIVQDVLKIERWIQGASQKESAE